MDATEYSAASMKSIVSTHISSIVSTHISSIVSTHISTAGILIVHYSAVLPYTVC